MCRFDETSHAFLSACFYRLLKEGEYHDAAAVFRFAVRLYAQERGLRMAQRALRIEEEDTSGTLFEKLPEDWVCPECAEAKDQFIEA